MQKKDDLLQVSLMNGTKFMLSPVKKPLLSFVQFDCPGGYIVELDRRQDRLTVTVGAKNNDMEVYRCTRKQHPLYMKLFEAETKSPEVSWYNSSECDVSFGSLLNTFVCDEKILTAQSFREIFLSDDTKKYLIEIVLNQDTLSVTAMERTDKKNVWKYERPRKGTDWYSVNTIRNSSTYVNESSASRLNLSKGGEYYYLSKVPGSDDPKSDRVKLDELKLEVAQLKEKLTPSSCTSFKCAP